jgi:high-affinity iron transporter
MKITMLTLMALIPIWNLRAMPTSPELIDKGRKSYEMNCAVCHGPGGRGDGPAGLALNPKPRNLAGETFKAGLAPEQVFNTVTNGLKGSNMQGFPSLSEDERWGLAYFVLSLRK